VGNMIWVSGQVGIDAASIDTVASIYARGENATAPISTHNSGRANCVKPTAEGEDS